MKKKAIGDKRDSYNFLANMTIAGTIIFACLFVSAKSFGDWDVGDRCGSKNERECTLITDCNEALNKLKAGKPHGLDRCGFRGKIEIVCCERREVISKVPVRSSIVACERFSKTYNISSQPFIIGGENASLGEFPYIAAIGFEGDGPDDVKWGDCGGSLISENFILTAAHCLVRVDSKNPKMVRLGKIDLTGDEDKVPAQDIPISESIIHPEYKHIEKQNDIALLRLSRDVTFSENVKAVCLSSSSDIPVGLIVAGWGIINTTTEETSRFLQKAYVKPYDLSKCNQTYLDSPRKKTILDSQLCAFSPTQDTCQGDSGGPLQIQNKKDTPQTPLIVVGITSYGRGCAGSMPSVYTRV
ncbi:Trypsin, partial [Oryctes borbonicus]